MIYELSIANPHLHFLDIRLTIHHVEQDQLEVQLPAWRPGRYELGNFAKNVQRWTASDDQGNPLTFRKVSKDCWQIDAKGCGTVVIDYNYYANELNAGSTWLDEEQLYVNPVNCFLYVPDRMEETCEVKLNVPETYRVATSLQAQSKHHFIAGGFQELADSPFIASDSLQSKDFEVDGVRFWLHFQGPINPDWKRLEEDFVGYTRAQFKAFGDFPVKEYHYLFQIAPYKLYHGVEHQASTVVALGPGHEVMKAPLYDELLGVSSHELYHTWNIKNIRPAEMYPYDFSKENYSRLGYVAEGVTTYMGDLMLLRGGVWNLERYLKELTRQIQRHQDNFGRFNLSVADSSYDTWLDGYVAGIPHRKVSIYVEGCLLAFICDVQLQQATHGEKSIHDAMRLMYERFGKAGRGYTENDYKQALEEVSELDFTHFFNDFVNGTNDYLPRIEESLEAVGLQLQTDPSKLPSEGLFGFKVSEAAGGAKVMSVHPGSPAEAVLAPGDVITAVNGFEVKNDLNARLADFSAEEVRLNLMRGGKLRKVTLAKVAEKSWYKTYQVVTLSTLSSEQERLQNSWAHS